MREWQIGDPIGDGNDIGVPDVANIGGRQDEDRYNFVFTDRISVTAQFDMADGRTAVYDIDLDNMKLSDEFAIS